MAEPHDENERIEPSRRGAGASPPDGRRQRPPSRIWGGLALAAVAVAVAVAAYALSRGPQNPSNDGATLSDRLEADLAMQMDVPQELLKYTEQRRIATTLAAPHALAISPEGTIFVAGGGGVEMLRPDGSRSRAKFAGESTCIALSHAEEAPRIFVGAERRIVVLGEDGELLEQWPAIHEKSVLTSLAIAGDHLFVADAGQRLVLHYLIDGTPKGVIGQADPDRQMPGFIIPSPYFDLAVSDDELLYVVNPGMRRVEVYDFDGQLQSFWGQAGSGFADFFGCCNPAQFALRADGCFVTSEKGIPRIKVYSPDGDLLHAVAGPRQLGIAPSALVDARGNQQERVFDVALDAASNILALDAVGREIIVFEPMSVSQGAESQP